MTIYPIQQNGQWFKIKGRKHRIACCDCGLVHDLEFRIRKGKIEFRAFRHNRATGQKRRWMACHRPSMLKAKE